MKNEDSWFGAREDVKEAKTYRNEIGCNVRRFDSRMQVIIRMGRLEF